MKLNIITTFYPNNRRTIIEFESKLTVKQVKEFLEKDYNCCVGKLIRSGSIIYDKNNRITCDENKTLEDLNFNVDDDYLYVMRDRTEEVKRKYDLGTSEISSELGSTTSIPSTTPSWYDGIELVDQGFDGVGGGSGAGASMGVQSTSSGQFNQAQLFQNIMETFLGSSGLNLNTSGGGGGGSGGGGGGGSGGGGGDRTITSQVSEEMYTYSNELVEIVNMGFNDIDKIKNFLKITNGNVEQSVNLLLG